MDIKSKSIILLLLYKAETFQAVKAWVEGPGKNRFAPKVLIYVFRKISLSLMEVALPQFQYMILAQMARIQYTKKITAKPDSRK